MSLAVSSDNPIKRIAGIDEVGRGCIVGPVVAAAVILDPDRPIAGLADSKKLSEKKRNLLAAEIKSKALCWAVARGNMATGVHTHGVAALVSTTGNNSGV